MSAASTAPMPPGVGAAEVADSGADEEDDADAGDAHVGWFEGMHGEDEGRDVGEGQVALTSEEAPTQSSGRGRLSPMPCRRAEDG